MEINSDNDHLLKNNVNAKANLPNRKAQVILADTLFPEQQDDSILNKDDPLATMTWKIYTKAKDALPNGLRLENLTWRMMAMALKKSRRGTSTGLQTEREMESTGALMDVDSNDLLSTDKQYSQTTFSSDLFASVSSSSSNKGRYTASTVVSNSSINIPADASQQVSSSLYPTLLKNTTSRITATPVDVSTPNTHPGTMSFEGLLESYYAALDHSSETSSLETTSSLNTTELSAHVSPSPTETTASVSLGQSRISNTKDEERKPALTKCFNCETSTTPLWRRNPDGQPLCNACGLFLKLHGVVRPLSLKSNVVKKRNRINPNTTSTGNHANANNFISNNVGLTGVIGKRNNDNGVIQNTSSNLEKNSSNNIPQSSSTQPTRPPSPNKRQRRDSQEEGGISSPMLQLSSSHTSLSDPSSFPGLVIGSLPKYQSQHYTLNSNSSTTLLQQHSFENHPFYDTNSNDNMIVGSAPILSWMRERDQNQQSEPLASFPSSQLKSEQLQQLVFLYEQQSIVHSGMEMDGGNNSSSVQAWNVFTP